MEQKKWALTSRLVDVLQRCEGRMLKYMAGVRWQDGKSSSEVAEMCGVDGFSVKLRQRRLRCFGQVKRADGGVLGLHRKKWYDCVMEDMNLLGVEEHVVQDQRMWKVVIVRPPHSRWKNADVKRE